MKEFFKNLLEFSKKTLSSNDGTPSSKRVCGVTGWLVIIGILIYSTYTSKPTPSSLEEFMWTSAALLGVETVASMFNRNKQE